jgi:hypothetical protein
MTIERMQDAIEIIDFNDRLTLLNLVEFARNASNSYGIASILEQFVEKELGEIAKSAVAKKYVAAIHFLDLKDTSGQ